MPMRILALVALISLLSITMGCQPVMPETESPQLANPASVHCSEQGGKLDIRTEDAGGEVGYCLFDDGSECEEWAYFRGDCQPGEFPASASMANPASVYCGEEGGTLEIRTAEDGGQFGVCVFEDGSECEEWAFFRDECKPGE